MDRIQFEAEVDRNFETLKAHLPQLLETHAGEFVLMRGGAMVSFFPSEQEALASGRRQFADGLFSVQEVTDRPVDLGFFSHTINSRIA